MFWVGLVTDRPQLDLSPRRLPDDATLVARQLSEMANGLYASPAYLKRYGELQTPPELMQHLALQLIGCNGSADRGAVSDPSGVGLASQRATIQ